MNLPPIKGEDGVDLRVQLIFAGGDASMRLDSQELMLDQPNFEGIGELCVLNHVRELRLKYLRRCTPVRMVNGSGTIRDARVGAKEQLEAS